MLYNLTDPGDLFPHKIGRIKIIVINMLITEFMGKNTTFFGIYPKHLVRIGRKNIGLVAMGYIFWCNDEMRWKFCTVEQKDQLNKECYDFGQEKD